MPARYRELDERPPESGTSYWYITGTTGRSFANGAHHKCWDVVGNFPNVNPFEKHTITTIRGVWDGEQWNTGHTQLLRKLTNYAADRVATTVDPRTFYGTFLPGDVQNAMRSLLNRTSPSRPDVSLPTFVAELKDFAWLKNLSPRFGYPQLLKKMASEPPMVQFPQLPKLIRSWGNTLLGQTANSYISWRWVIKPMISDLRKMVQFTHIAAKRERELRRLAEGSGVRKRVSLEQDKSETPVTRVSYHSSSGTPVTYADVWTKHEKSVWGTARWKPSSSPLPKTDSDFASKAFRLSFGITSFEALQTLWEVFPWSWFVDWFVEFGSVISLHNNSVNCYWADAAVMRTISSDRIVRVDPATIPGWRTLSVYPVEEHVIKERYNDLSLWLPNLPTSLPLLEKGKWSILTALAAANVDRGIPRKA